MKVLQAARIIVVIVILVAILLPIAIVNGTIEKQPTSDVFGIGMIVNSKLTSAEDFRKSASRWIFYNAVQVSPSESVLLGKDGWMFYTLDHDLDIPRGTYPLSQEQLDYQVAAFSNTKKYYELMGADFYLLPYPSKPSIYPEYISGEDLAVGRTACDIVSDNLRSRTDVNVISPKQQIIADKALGLVYMKKDVHTSDLGAYATYKTICKEISAHSNINISPIPVNFVDGEYPVSFNDIAKVPGLFGNSETGPTAQYEAHAHRVTEGAFYNSVISVVKKNDVEETRMVPWSVIFENPEAKNGTLLVYGTSMFTYDNLGEEWQLLRYLAENFKKIVYVGISTQVMPELDSIVSPDFVIVDVPERYLSEAGYRDVPRVPIVADTVEVESIPVTEQINDIGNGGFCLEYIGTQELPSTSKYIEIGDQNSIILSGWAEDTNTKSPLSALYLQLGDKTFKCNYGHKKEALSTASALNTETDYTEFTIEIPRIFFDGLDKISFICVGTDGSYRYKSLIYTLK